MKRHPYFAGLCLGLVLLTGCCHLAMGSRPFPHQPLPKSLAAEVAVPKPGGFLLHEISLQTNHTFIVRGLELTVPASPASSNVVIVLDYFQPVQTNSPVPVVLVLAISGGNYELEHHVARYFARHGFAAIVIHRPVSDALFTTGGQINEMLRWSVQNDQRVMDWIIARPEFDAQRIMVFAVSLGAIQGTMFVSVEPRVRAAVLGLVGGDVADILTHSRERSYVRRREAMLRDQHLTLAELQQQFAVAIKCDPIYFAPYVEREKVMLVLAVYDHIVPFKNGWNLREQMGEPETLLIDAGHFTALLYLPYIESQALDFYRRRFELKQAEP
jgi:hypothetical protein